MSKEYVSITYENNIFYCTKNNTKWISVDGERWYGEEKRIAELKEENDNLVELNNGLIKEAKYYKDIIDTNSAEWEEQGKRVCELEKELSENKVADMEIVNGLCNQIQDLQKENAELKRNKKTVVHLAECLEEKQEEQLTQAKKIIKGLLSCCRNYPQENAEKIEQAERFLKEIEK